MHMKPSDHKFVRQWAETRKMGRIKYAFIHGIIFGLILFLFTGIYNLFEKPFGEVFLTLRSAIVCLFWIVSGIIGYAVLMWPVNEYFFRRKQESGFNSEI